MRLKIKAWANLRYYLPGDREDLEVEVPDGATVEAVLEQVGIPACEVMLVKTPGGVVKRSHVPKDGDELEFLPIVSGG